MFIFGIRCISKLSKCESMFKYPEKISTLLKGISFCVRICNNVFLSFVIPTFCN
jgi:hypothetical protein